MPISNASVHGKQDTHRTAEDDVLVDIFATLCSAIHEYVFVKTIENGAR